MDEPNVILFQPRLRLVRAPVDGPSSTQVEPALVEHNGRAYRLADLLAHLRPLKLARIEATAPRSGQAAWDEVVRRWPALAELIAAGTACA